MPVPVVEFTDERLPNGLRLIVAEDHLAPVVAVNVWYDVGSKHEVAGQDRLRAPVRARDVPGLRARREGGAHGARPGRRRDPQRHDLARPHELLRDPAVAPAGARDLARGGPHGQPPRRAEPGEPRQPARGREEREALELRQPAVRLVEREDSSPTCSRRSTRTTTRRSARWPTSTPPRSTTSAAFFRDLLRPQQRDARRRGRLRAGAGPRVGRQVLRRRSRPTRRSRRCRDLSLPPTARRGDPRDGRRTSVPLPRIFFGFRAPAFGDTRARRRSTWPASCSRAARGAGSIGASSARSAWRRTSRSSRSRSSGAPRSPWAGRRSGRASTSPRSRPPIPTSSTGSRRRRRSDDELARAKALTEADELGSLARVEERADRLVDVRDAVRRPGPDQHACCRATSSVTAGADPRRGPGGLPRRQPGRPDLRAQRRRRRDRGGRGMSEAEGHRRAARPGPPAPVRLPRHDPHPARQRPAGHRHADARAGARVGLARLPRGRLGRARTRRAAPRSWPPAP